MADRVRFSNAGLAQNHVGEDVSAAASWTSLRREDFPSVNEMRVLCYERALHCAASSAHVRTHISLDFAFTRLAPPKRREVRR